MEKSRRKFVRRAGDSPDNDTVDAQADPGPQSSVAASSARNAEARSQAAQSAGAKSLPELKPVLSDPKQLRAELVSIDNMTIGEKYLGITESEIKALKAEARHKSKDVLSAIDLYSMMDPAEPRYNEEEFTRAWTALCERVGTAAAKECGVFSWTEIARAVSNEPPLRAYNEHNICAEIHANAKK